MAPPRFTGLTKLTLETAPSVCHECVWWQSRGSRGEVDKDRWMSRVEEEYGAFGTVYHGDGGKALGVIQYGPAPLFPHAWELPAGPPSEDAMLVTCAYLVDSSAPWVMQSLFLAAIGEARDRDFSCVEAFAYRYQEGESSHARFREHRTVFPSDFLGDFGFRVVRTSGRVGLARLELGGLVAVEEGRRARVLRVVKEAFLPEPVPAPRPELFPSVGGAACPATVWLSEVGDVVVVVVVESVVVVRSPSPRLPASPLELVVTVGAGAVVGPVAEPSWPPEPPDEELSVNAVWLVP